jgi:hypothetical protein
MGELRNAYKTLLGKAEGKTPLQRAMWFRKGTNDRLM